MRAYYASMGGVVLATTPKVGHQHPALRLPIQIAYHRKRDIVPQHRK